MTDGSTYVGLDVHKKSIVVAALIPGREEAVRWEVPNEARALARLARKLLRESSGQVVCCYEAGVCGYAVQRQLQAGGVRCRVVAPSLIPVRPGERIKTDARDALKLARLLRSGLLTEVAPPTTEEEAVRDLCRAREAVLGDLTRCRNRLMKMLLRKGIIYRQGARAWTVAYRRWLNGITFDSETERLIFEDHRLAIDQMEARLEALQAAIEGVAQREPYRPAVGWLCCLRGVKTLTAMTILSELHGFRRFTSARHLMGYLGMGTSVHASADTLHRGRITRAGNAHVRRVLVEAAWNYQHPATVSPTLRRRRQGQPAWAVAIADRALVRLHRRFVALKRRGKPHNKAVVAVARELVGFIWAVLYRDAERQAA